MSKTAGHWNDGGALYSIPGTRPNYDSGLSLIGFDSLTALDHTTVAMQRVTALPFLLLILDVLQCQRQVLENNVFRFSLLGILITKYDLRR